MTPSEVKALHDRLAAQDAEIVRLRAAQAAGAAQGAPIDFAKLRAAINAIPYVSVTLPGDTVTVAGKATTVAQVTLTVELPGRKPFKVKCGATRVNVAGTCDTLENAILAVRAGLAE